jgi:hypothetical protein
VNVVDTKEDVLKDYGAMMDKFYGTFKPRTIQKNHIFRVEDTDASLLMQCSTHSEAPFVKQAMLKIGQMRGDKKRVAEMEAFELHTLEAPGLRPIKKSRFIKSSALLCLVTFGETLVPDQVMRSWPKSRMRRQISGRRRCLQKDQHLRKGFGERPMSRTQ